MYDDRVDDNYADDAPAQREPIASPEIPLPTRGTTRNLAAIVTPIVPSPDPARVTDRGDSYKTTASQLLIADIPKKSYTLAGLEGQASLAVHADHNNEAPILGKIPSTAEVEALGICLEAWCLIRNGELRGWVEWRHLAEKDSPVTKRFKFEQQGTVNSLKLYDYPKAEANIIKEISSPANDIAAIGDCGTQWCHVSHLGSAGWVYSEYLTRQ